MYNVSESYGHDHNPFGVYDMDDAALASRARGLSAEIGSLMRTLNRFEDFCDRIDLKALDEKTLAGVYDTACGTDWRVYEAGNELDAVELELKSRRAAEAQPERLYDATRMDDPNWFWNF